MSVVVFCRDATVEIIAGVLPTSRMAAEPMLALARDLDAGGLVTEQGAYLLKEVLPLRSNAADVVIPAVARMAMPRRVR